MPSILGTLQAYRKTAVEAGDKRWDAGEVEKLAALAKGEGGDQFTTAGRSYLTVELHGTTELTPDAKQTLMGLLAAQAAHAPDKPRLEAFLAVQEGGSNKFYALATEGTSLVTRWGAIGKDGQSKTESFATAAEADKAFVKTLRGKLAKGYVAADPDALGIKAASAGAAPGAASGGASGAAGASGAGGAASVAGAAAAGGALPNLTAFLALPTAKQDEILGWSNTAEAAGLTVTPSLALAQITDPKLRAFADKLVAAASDATGGFEVHDDEYIKVGDTEVTVELYLLPSGEPAGGQVHAHQQGVEYPEDYWDNEDAYDDAKLKALADATDVSWSCSGTYANTKKGELRTISDPDYMEWSGY